MSSIQVLLLSALVMCASCKHHAERPAAPSGNEDPEAAGSSQPQAGAGAEPNRLCVEDASTCPRAACTVSADCKPTDCQQATCVDAECTYAPVPAGSPCGAEQVCSQTGSCGDCVPGTQRCPPGSATMLETCSDQGSWQRSACEGQACFNAQCTGECEPGSATCEAGNLRRCGVDGRYAAAAACAAGSCNNGSCPGECQPAESRCLDLYRSQSCSEQGTWSAVITCSDQRCDSTTGTCQSACAAGVNRCAQDELSQCEPDGRWGAAISCPNGCTARGCNTCRPGSRECLDSQSARTCGEDGNWQPATACPMGCQEQRCKTCSEGELRCTATAVEACSAAGAWIERDRCPVGCTENHCNLCAPNSAECPSQRDRMLIRFCKPDGTWKATEGCRANAHCVGGTGNTCPCNPGYRPNGRPGNPDAGDCVPM